jgi:pimeloyl-ACP methyl ester carboxylesterase
LADPRGLRRRQPRCASDRAAASGRDPRAGAVAAAARSRRPHPERGRATRDRFDALVDVYTRPGAFAASIAWYRAGAGTVAQAQAERPPDERLAVPTTVLWPAHDPLFPVQWSDRVDEFFADAEVRVLPDAGHFTPLEAPAEIAAAIRAATGTSA